MLAFEITINGQRRYLAGHSSANGLTVYVSGDCQAGDAHVLGAVSIPDAVPGGTATLRYEDYRAVVGDEITIRIVDADAPDAPRRQEHSAAFGLASANAHLR